MKIFEIRLQRTKFAFIFSKLKEKHNVSQLKSFQEKYLCGNVLKQFKTTSSVSFRKSNLHSICCKFWPLHSKNIRISKNTKCRSKLPSFPQSRLHYTSLLNTPVIIWIIHKWLALKRLMAKQQFIFPFFRFTQTNTYTMKRLCVLHSEEEGSDDD